MPLKIPSLCLATLCGLLFASEGRVFLRAEAAPAPSAPLASSLSTEDRAALTKPVGPRRPKSPNGQSAPELWPTTPTAGYGGWSKATGSVWMGRHEKLVTTAQAMPDAEIVLLGDALLNDWLREDNGVENLRESWSRRWGTRKTLNLAIGSEKVEYLLWRLQHGAIDGLSPKAVILAIGQNNVPQIQRDRVPAEAIAAGIQRCIQTLRAKVPSAQIIVCKLPPSGPPEGAVRQGINSVNSQLDRLALTKTAQVSIVDLAPGLSRPDGSLNDNAYAYRHLRPKSAGYELIAQALQPAVNAALADRSAR